MGQILAAVVLLLQLAFGQTEAPYIIPAGSTYDGDIATITTDIQIDGDVQGDVTSWTGNIRVSGNVRGDIVSYTGSVTLLPTAYVHGNIMSIGGGLHAEPAQLEGHLLNGGAGGQYLSLLVGFVSPGSSVAAGIPSTMRWPVSLLVQIVLMVLCLLVLWIWPNRTRAAATILVGNPMRATAIGILTGIALAALLPLVAALLAITLIGLPLSIILLAAAHVPAVLGLATLMQAVRTLRHQQASRIDLNAVIVTAVLILPITLMSVVSPSLALIVFYILASPGLGAFLLGRTRSRFPTLAY